MVTLTKSQLKKVSKGKSKKQNLEKEPEDEFSKS
jgi:hypothetical protein